MGRDYTLTTGSTSESSAVGLQVGNQGFQCQSVDRLDKNFVKASSQQAFPVFWEGVGSVGDDAWRWQSGNPQGYEAG